MKERLEPHQWEDEIERCYPQVLRGLVAVAGSRERAEDAMQEAILAALRQGVADVKRLDAWLYVVGLRALRRSQWRDRLLVPLKFVRATTPEPDLERVTVIDVLNGLTPRQREFIVARYYLGLPYDEIADTFSVSLGTARSTVTHGLAKLRRALKVDRLDALSMAFVDDHAYVSTSTQLVELVDSSDLAQFPSVRVIADVGGQLLGRLVDGRLLLASLSPARVLTLTAAGLDGRTERVASVSDAAGPIAVVGSTATLLRSRRASESFAGDATLVNVDLVTGGEIFNQPVGTLNNLTFAATHTSVGYVFTDPKAFFACCDYAGLVTFGARGSVGGNWSQHTLTRHRLPVLDPRLSWSPDDRYIAFATDWSPRTWCQMRTTASSSAASL